jgi:hypothetical protein
MRSLATEDHGVRAGDRGAIAILSDDHLANQVAARASVRRVLLAQDLGVSGVGGGQLAEALARRSNALLDVVAVVDGFTEIFHKDNAAMARDPDQYLASVGTALDVCVGAYRARGVRCTGTLVVGEPSSELLRHAAGTRPDLLVLSCAPEIVGRVQTALRWRAFTVWRGSAPPPGRA